MRPLVKRWTAIFFLFLSLTISSIPAYAAGGTITVSYNNGGSVTVVSAVTMEGNVIYVEDNTKVQLLAVPNEGYEVKGVYLNDQTMGISGAGTKTIDVAPNGSDVFLRVTFVKSELAGKVPEEPPAVTPTPAPIEHTQPAPEPTKPVPASPPVAPSETQPQTSAPEITDVPEESETPTPMPTKPVIINPPEDTPYIEPIANGGIGNLESPNASRLSQNTKTWITVVGASILLAAIITIYLIRKEK